MNKDQENGSLGGPAQDSDQRDNHTQQETDKQVRQGAQEEDQLDKLNPNKSEDEHQHDPAKTDVKINDGKYPFTK